MAVQFVGRINREIYRCVTEDITTDEVIITEERIQHIKERHRGDFEIISPFLESAVTKPDYILEDAANTGLILKEVDKDGLRLQIVLRIHTSRDPAGYKNSILSGWVISESRWKNYLRNKKILYKRV